MLRTSIAALALAALLAGCAGKDERPGSGAAPPEFVGRVLRVETARGEVSRLRFRRDGSVRARFGERETQGRWSLERRRLCFTWAGSFRECWPYTARFERGRTRTIRSDRGNVVQVTLQ